MGYTKLFDSIIASSIWQEDLVTKVVWITMLALKNRDQVVESSVPGLAHIAGVERAECERALTILKSPDPDSRNKDHEGRRIEEVKGGWLILNGKYYQDLMGREDRREKLRIYQQKCRDRKKEREGGGAVTMMKRNPDCPAIPTIESYADGQAPPPENYNDIKSNEVPY
jgi:hypothetical protein